MPWQSPQAFPTLKTNQIHVWRATLGRSKKELAELSGMLNPQEKERADKFIAKNAKNNFIVARGILRNLLANYLSTEPQKLSFQQNQYGKIRIEASELQFNISHSCDLALFAFTLKHPIGVDIEFIRDDFDFIPIAQRFFSAKENLDLLALPTDQQLQAFFNCWSRKEAFIKAVGTGVFCALNEFSVEVSDKKEGRLQIQFTSAEFNSKDWSLEALDPMEGYAGAFATPQDGYEIKRYLVQN
jgi:4'-phosphopantetheinyl transferase